MGRYRRLLTYLIPYKTVFALGLGAAVVASVLDGLSFALLIPLLRVLFDLGSAVGETPTIVERFATGLLGTASTSGTTRNLLGSVAAAILITMVLKNLALYASTLLSRYIEEAFTRDLRRDLYRHMQTLGLSFFQRARGGDLQTRMVSDVDQARLLVSSGLQTVVRNGVLILVYVAILLSLSWRLGFITLLLAPAVALLIKPIVLRVRSRLRRAVSRRGELSAVLAETVAGVRLVKAHAAERHERRRFEGHLKEYFAQTMGAERIGLLASPLSEMLGAVVFVLLLLAGSSAALGAEPVRPELMMVFLGITLRLLSPVKKLAQFPAIAEQALAGAERVFSILDEPSDDVDRDGEASFVGLRRSVEFDNVWFAYRDDDWVLQGVDLTIHQGEVVAIVGCSGAGKSTLVDLLPRFVDPTRGEVRLDGVPTVSLSRASLRRAVAIVSHDTVIFNDTVAANIGYGMPPGLRQQRIEEAARIANADAFVRRLPNGYHTVLGERGMQLSGGERQRIAIARAVLRDPPILVLDEATSALDVESERLIQQAIDRLMENRTVLIIGHRLSTVARADRIVVLDGGRIVEEGSHHELVERGGLYGRLHDLALVE